MWGEEEPPAELQNYKPGVSGVPLSFLSTSSVFLLDAILLLKNKTKLKLNTLAGVQLQSPNGRQPRILLLLNMCVRSLLF